MQVVQNWSFATVELEICCQIFQKTFCLSYDGRSYCHNRDRTVITNRLMKTGQAVYVWIIDELSRNHFCRRKPINITYSELVSVALVTQAAKSVRHIIICGLSGSAIFSPHYLIKKRFSENIIKFSTTVVCNISHSKKNWVRY